jgi:phage terminase large subunit
MDEREKGLRLNSAYRQAWEWQDRYIDLYGGAGSGKSVFAAQKIILRAASTSGHKFLVVRKVGRTLRGSCFSLIRSIIANMGLTVTVNKTEMTITFPNGSEITHTGLDDVEKLKSVHGITGIWVEEATELTEVDFTQLDLRLRGESPDYKQIILSYNPINIFHWLKKNHHDKLDPRRLIVKTTYKDNEFIDADYKQVLESIQDKNYNRIYMMGEWGVQEEGLIYTHWKTSELPPAVDETFYGLDFGFNNPTSLVKVCIRDKKYYVQEMLYQSQLITQDIINIIKPIVGRSTVYCDSAEPARIKEIQKAGIRAKEAKKDVALGIEFVKGVDLFITPDSHNLIKELRVYKWKESTDGTFKDKEPLKFMDHACDAMRYAIYTYRQGGAFTVFD